MTQKVEKEVTTHKAVCALITLAQLVALCSARVLVVLVLNRLLKATVLFGSPHHLPFRQHPLPAYSSISGWVF